MNAGLGAREVEAQCGSHRSRPAARGHRRHNGRPRTIGQLCCSIARTEGVRYLIRWGRPAGNDRGTSGVSFRPSSGRTAIRGWHRHERERAPFRPWAIGREAKKLCPLSSRPQDTQSNYRPSDSISPHTNQHRNIPRYHPRRNRNCRPAEPELIEKVPQFGRSLCLRPMPTVGTIVGIGVGTPVGIGRWRKSGGRQCGPGAWCASSCDIQGWLLIAPEPTFDKVNLSTHNSQSMRRATSALRAPNASLETTPSNCRVGLKSDHSGSCASYRLCALAAFAR
jgi:hypothetical protein